VGVFTKYIFTHDTQGLKPMARIGKNQLIRLQETYKTDRAIARLYGISRQAVHQMRVKYNVQPSGSPIADRNIEIRKQYANGLTGAHIARRYNLSVSQVYRIVGGHTVDHTSAGERRKNSARDVKEN
jgi:DNA invertase Pin-like site-specific DNA recombinase